MKRWKDSRTFSGVLETRFFSLSLPISFIRVFCTARCVEDETRNDRRNANRNPEWWADLSQLQNYKHNLDLYWEIQRNSNSIEISIFICTARYRWIWVFRCQLIEENQNNIQDCDLHFNDHSESLLPRNVSSSKSYVSFAECRLFYRALLPKRRIILRSLQPRNGLYPHCL